jgi:hypothetical protein
MRTAYDQYVVSGDSNSEPSYRAILANLCDNHWSSSISDTIHLSAGQGIRYVHTFESYWCKQVFTSDSTPATVFRMCGTSQSPGYRVTLDQDAVAYSPESGGREGGGS